LSGKRRENAARTALARLAHLRRLEHFQGLPVAPALDENIENEAVLVDGMPEPMLLPGEADDDLIEVPFICER
jgi:hypothetical protein